MRSYYHFIRQLLKSGSQQASSSGTSGTLPTADVLSHRGLNCSQLCLRCGQNVETTMYVFKDCVWAKGIWFGSPLGMRVDDLMVCNLEDWTRLGFIVRNEMGKVTVAGGRCILEVFDVEVVEAMSLLFAINVTADFGFTNVMFESDAVTLVSKFNIGKADS
ncbi:conserved hypothetical protein [Ricinus communis]|uniref:RNase H type-1 domain-containing protein n=1 Tax=Ricinus communis TaxID=3988 RepID=B9S3S6_RICCO|nr:conserved hypothetical protein [Ricinus communis]